MEKNTSLDTIKEIDIESWRVLQDLEINNDENLKMLCYDSLRDIFPGNENLMKRAKLWKIISKESDTETTTDTMSLSKISSAASNKCEVSSPHFTIYCDSDVLNGTMAGNIPIEIRHRLVRATIHSMISETSVVNRYPYIHELNEMAKSLIIKYPCLADENELQPHYGILKQLKRRLSNLKPVKKPQGPASKKKKYKMNESASTSNSENTDTDLPKDSTEKPSTTNTEFVERRQWVKSIEPKERCKSLLDRFVCFKIHTQIVYEVKRILLASGNSFIPIIDGDDKEEYLKICCENLVQEIDIIVNYAIQKKNLCPPKRFCLRGKLIYIIRNLHLIFTKNNGKKATKNALEILIKLKETEDPQTIISKRNGHLPIMLVDNSQVAIVVGNNLLTSIRGADFFIKGFCTELASFYLLDFDYPKFLEVPLCILQQIIFKDSGFPSHIAVLCGTIFNEYAEFKLESSDDSE